METRYLDEKIKRIYDKIAEETSPL